MSILSLGLTDTAPKPKTMYWAIKLKFAGLVDASDARANKH